MCEICDSRWSMWIIIFIMVWTVIQTMGCGTNRSYPDEVKPPSKVAELHEASSFAVWADRADIDSVDGEYVGGNFVKVEMLPGDHIVRLTCMPPFPSIYTSGSRSGPIKLSVEAAHQYQTYCDIYERKASGRDKVYFWIEDLTTGDIVGGKKP